MKLSREARRMGRKLFRACLVNGRMDEQRVRSLASTLVAQKPRHYLGILAQIQKLVKTETQKYALLVESAVLLDETQFRVIQSKVEARFPVPLTATHAINSALIGGIRVKVGNDVWDGSVAARLRQLEVQN